MLNSERILYCIIKQLDLKTLDWSVIAKENGISVVALVTLQESGGRRTQQWPVSATRGKRSVGEDENDSEEYIADAPPKKKKKSGSKNKKILGDEKDTEGEKDNRNENQNGEK